jgi:hypothetical protein
MSIFTDLAQALFPQPETNEPPHVFKWRQTVAGCIILLGGFQMVSSVLAWGLAPFLFAGFVNGDQFQELRQLGMDIRISQIERSIKDAKEAVCMAQAEGSMPALELASAALSKAVYDYQRVAKASPRIPTAPS